MHIPDRSHILTEQRNPRTAKLHALDVAGCVDAIQAEDREIVGAMERARPAIVGFLAAVEAQFLAGGRLIYVGAGTSGRLGVLDASEAPPTFQIPEGRIIGIIAGGDGSLRQSSEGKEDEASGSEAELARLGLTERDTVLGIAAGGTTPYALGALAISKRLTGGKAVTGLLCCAPIEKPVHADHLMVIETGAEVLTGSTRMKAGTATKLALNTISTTLMIRSGRVYENLMVDLRASNTKLRDRAARIVSALTGVTRTEAFGLVDEASGSVKVAVAMRRLGVSREIAESRLAEADGRLERVIG